MARVYKSKEIVDHFYEVVSLNENKDGVFKCRCGVKRKQNIKNGYSNLINHINEKHPDWKECMLQVSMASASRLTSFVSTKASNVFSWIEWILMENREFTFCEQTLTKKNTKLEPICTRTMLKYVDLLHMKVKENLRNILPDTFGIVFDGWSDGSNHYVAIFANHQAYQGRTCHLLAISPLLEEEDLSASSHQDYIEDVLQTYDKSSDNILYLVGDNCKTNKATANMLGVPLIGCASHRLNLAVNNFLKLYEGTLDSIHNLMKKLNTIKKAAALHKKTHLCPISRNKTRWSSTYEMVKRYFEIKDYLNMEDADIVSLIPSASDELELKATLEHLENIESVTKKLQESTITLKEVRILFDALIETYPDMREYLEADAEIVHSKDFEAALVKIMNGKEKKLTRKEKDAVKKLRLGSDLEVFMSAASTYAEKALQAKKQKAESEYGDLSYIAPTSNICERLFSSAKLILTDQRKSMGRHNFESALFLRINRSLWDVGLVSAIIHKE